MADLVKKLSDIEAEQEEIRKRTQDLTERVAKIETKSSQKPAEINGKYIKTRLRFFFIFSEI